MNQKIYDTLTSRTIRKFNRAIRRLDSSTEANHQAADDSGWGRVVLGRFRHDQPVLQALMVPFPVIVLSERHEPATEMRLAQDHQAVQTFFLDRSDEPFGVGVAVGRRVGCLDHTNAGGRQRLPNGGAPFRIAITDQEVSPPQTAVVSVGRRARHLQYKALIGMRRGPHDLHPP
jgi:hypothetical protein